MQSTSDTDSCCWAWAGPAVPVDPSDLLSRSGALYGTLGGVTGLKIGYARVSTAGQDLTAQRDGLAALGVEAARVYVDHGLTGTSRAGRWPPRGAGLRPRRYG